MRIATTITLESDDAFAYTPDGAAAQVLAALGGNPTNDYSEVYVQQASSGTAGTEPAPPASRAEVQLTEGEPDSEGEPAE